MITLGSYIGCHENGYVSALNSFITSGHKEKLILLPGYADMAVGIGKLGLPSLSIPDLFLAEKTRLFPAQQTTGRTSPLSRPTSPLSPSTSPLSRPPSPPSPGPPHPTSPRIVRLRHRRYNTEFTDGASERSKDGRRPRLRVSPRRRGSRSGSMSEGHTSEGHQSPDYEGESKKKVDWYD